MTGVMAGKRDPSGLRADSWAAAAGRGRAGFREGLASEWTKVRTVRSTVWTAAVMTMLTPGLAVFVGATGSLQPDDTVLGGSLTGAAPAMIAAASFGALVMSGEYDTGMIRTTFAARPRRLPVLAAKAVVVAASTLVLALVSGLLADQIGKLFLAGRGYLPGEPMPALLGVGLCFSAVAVLGLAAGAVLRHTAGAIIALVGVILLPTLIGPLFGDAQRWVGGASPTAALQKLAQSSDAAPDAVGTLGGWPSLWVVCGAYTAAALAAAAWALERRDA
jgi:ABC-2 type transport system permease protein